MLEIVVSLSKFDLSVLVPAHPISWSVQHSDVDVQFATFADVQSRGTDLGTDLACQVSTTMRTFSTSELQAPVHLVAAFLSLHRAELAASKYAVRSRAILAYQRILR